MVGVAWLIIIYYAADNYTNAMDFWKNWTEYEQAYSAGYVVIFLSFLSSAYIVVKVIAATIHTDSGFYFNYRGGSSNGDYIALYELISISGSLSFALLISVMGLIIAYLMWSDFDKSLAIMA